QNRSVACLEGLSVRCTFVGEVQAHIAEQSLPVQIFRCIQDDSKMFRDQFEMPRGSCADIPDMAVFHEHKLRSAVFADCFALFVRKKLESFEDGHHFVYSRPSITQITSTLLPCKTK